MEMKDLQKALEDRDTETVKKLATLETKNAGLTEQIATLEQKLLEGGDPVHGARKGKSLGDQFVESDNFKAFIETSNRRGKVDLQAKATLTSLTTDAAGSVGALANTYRDPNAVMLPQRRMTVRDLIPQVQITVGSVEVMVQKLGTRGAAMVAEGDPKPGSDMQFELKSYAARTIAHWMKASRQILDDVPQLKGMINTELLYGLQLKEESQLLSGDNTGQNLWGMIPQATAYVDPLAGSGSVDNFIDVVGRAMLQNALAEYPADGVVLHPSDWMEIRLTKDEQGRYIYGPPSEAVVPRIFGVPVVPTQAISRDKFLVGQFQMAATIYDRWAARVEVATENEDDFIKNLLTILAEERLAFAVKRPLALTYGDLTDALSA